ncbi:MAG TPA: hypothetical protein VFU23_10355 [Gemmatimonadales bacterium]|nr:hypothetical protein [Gemmatimonadales bacterium]
MRTCARAGLGMGLLLAAAGRLSGQSTISWAGPPLFILDVQGTALDEFPSAVKALNGVMTTVDKNGQRVLKVSSPSELLITLPQVLPAAFTVVVDLIPKACCNPEDFMLEGTPTRNRGAASVELTWHPSHIMAVGGGGDMYQSDMPADLAASTPGNPTQLVLEFNGPTIKLYTNGRRMYTLDKQFTRGRVLRVWLGGESESNAMYLAGLSVLSGAVASGVIAANTGGGPTPPPGRPGLPPMGPRQPTAPGGPTPSLPNGSTSYVPPLPGSQTSSSSQALIGPSPTVMRMGPTVTQGSAGPIVQWTALNGATGYTVKRWLSSDLTCCNNSSGTLAGPPWQDQALLASGTYVYEVSATLNVGLPVVEQAQFTRVMPVSTSTPSVPIPTTSSGTTAAPTPVVSAPIAAQTGTPVRTSSAAPPGSPVAAALAPTGPPPTSIAVTGTPSLAQLNWGSGVSGLRGVTYRVDRWLESNPTCCAAQSASLSFPAWTDEGLQWPGTYVFQVTELYPDGTFGVATTRYLRPDPVNPTNFRVVLVSAGSVYLKWDVVPNASWYELSGPGLGLPTFNATTGAYNVHNLAPGTYTWRVGTFYSSPNAPAPVSGPASAFPSVTATVP